MKRKYMILFLCFVIAVALTACGSSNNGGNQDKLPILGAGIYSASDNFNSYIGKAITNASKGVFEVNVEDGQNDQSTQNNQVDTMLAKGAKVIALSVVDVTAAPRIIEKAKEAGNVPVIFFNKEITNSYVMQSYDRAYFVGSTGVDYGATIQGQMIVDAWKKHPEFDKNGDGKLQIVNLIGDPGHTAALPRSTFVKKAIKDAGLDYELLAEDTGMWLTANAKDKMDAWISKFGDRIEFIIAANDAMALGALASIQAAGFNTNGKDSKKYIPIIGIDALPEMLSKIQSGEVLGSVLQDAKTQGEVIVKMAKNLVDGKDPMDGLEYQMDKDKAVRIPYKPVTAENLAEAKETYAMN
mgnify:CR=1 FL=1|jgi:methyl-galactoside transport system substrate-binding protein